MKFLEIIDQSFIGKFVQSKLDVLEHTDPNRIYVERIRSFYSLPFPIAKLLCEMAVKQKLFTKHIGIECPNDGRLILTRGINEALPQEIECTNCEALEEEQYRFKLSECHTVEFYKLNVQ